jgi:hypothetical protein
MLMIYDSWIFGCRKKTRLHGSFAMDFKGRSYREGILAPQTIVLIKPLIDSTTNVFRCRDDLVAEVNISSWAYV